MKNFTSLQRCVLASCLFLTASAWKPTVTIDSGVIVGTAVSLPTATAPVNEFLGIPFAQSPPERFSPPVPPKSWKKPLDTKEWKPACIQQFVCELPSQSLHGQVLMSVRSCIKPQFHYDSFQ
jgi:hypothetical protein